MKCSQQFRVALCCAPFLLLGGCLGGGSSSSGGGDGAGGGGDNGGSNGADVVSFSWQPHELALEARWVLHDVYFVNETTGWIVGEGDGFTGGRESVILRTTDAGASWTPQDSGTVNYLRAVHFVDENQGWIAVGNVMGLPPQVLHTSNQGQTWTAQDMPESVDDQHLYDVHFVDGNTGWAVGGTISVSGDPYGTKLIVHTSDGGNSWSVQLNKRVDADFEDGTTVTSPLTGVHFVNAADGWAVPGPENGTYYRTRNGGQTWDVEDTGITELTGLYGSRFLDVYFLNEQRGWLVAGGTIMRTTDGGANWSIQDNDVGLGLRSVHFVDASTGWVAGAALNRNLPIIKMTTDGGNTWETQEIDAGDADVRAMNALHATDRDTAWAVGNWASALRLTVED